MNNDLNSCGDGTEALPEWLSAIEGHVRQYCELRKIQADLEPFLHADPTTETATHMGVRLAAEREITTRMDYLAHVITDAVTVRFRVLGMLSKYPELRTTHNER